MGESYFPHDVKGDFGRTRLQHDVQRTFGDGATNRVQRQVVQRRYATDVAHGEFDERKREKTRNGRKKGTTRERNGTFREERGAQENLKTNAKAETVVRERSAQLPSDRFIKLERCNKTTVITSSFARAISQRV